MVAVQPTVIREAEPLPLVLGPSETVVVQGAPVPAGPWVVRSGLLLATRIAEDGRVLGVDLLGPGDIVGEPVGRESPVWVETLRRTRLQPASTDAQAALFAARAARAVALAGDLATLGVLDRVRLRMADLAARFGRSPPVGRSGVVVALPITQDLLASLCGTSRESANRALARLEQTGDLQMLGRGRFLLSPRPGRFPAQVAHRDPPGAE
jgi:CRP-like cAMP-binding protein